MWRTGCGIQKFRSGHSKEEGVFRPLAMLSGAQGPRAVIDGKEVINLSSNNYLGLNTHPRLVGAAMDATRRLGVQAGLGRLGFNTGASETPITPVIIGKGPETMRFSDRLFEEGVFAQGISYPTVPAEKLSEGGGVVP